MAGARRRSYLLEPVVLAIWLSVWLSNIEHPTYKQPFESSRGGEIGRRSGLKIRRPQGLVGSSPTPGTNNLILKPG